MAYGYRLYTVELREGQKRPALKFADTDCGAPGVRYPDYAADLLGEYVAKSWIHVPEVPDQSDGDGLVAPAKSPYIGKPVVRVKKIEKPDPNVLVVTFEYGRVGSHTTALGVPDVTNDASLENLAPSNEYRAILVTPAVGTKGVLAVESNGRSCPVNALRAVLRDRARHNAIIVDPKDQDSIKQGPWWQIQYDPIVDQTHLEAVLKDQAAQASIELTVKSTTGARTRGEKPIKISAASLDQKTRDKVTKTVKGWAKQTTTDAMGAKELAVIIGHGVENVDLESGLVKLEAGNEAPVALRPTHLGDVFTYLQPGGDKQTTKTLYKVVGAKVKSIQQAAQLQIDWPDWL
jgi:hypothetical protein